MNRAALCSIALLLAVAPSAVAGPIENLRAGEWYMVPNSHMSTVFPNPAPPGDPWAVIAAWSGGAYDTKRDRLIVWGGGHGDYSGNEIYAFNVGTLSWQRVNNPTMDVSGDEASGVYPDGRPRSRHTYDGVEYLPPPIDRFCGLGAGGTYPSAQIGTPRCDCFNFDTLQWERFADTPAYGHPVCSAYDPVRGHVWEHPPGTGSQLAEFNPVANTWTQRGASSPGDIYYCNGEVDPIRRKFIAIGNGIAASWNIDAAGTLARTNLPTSGATAIQSAENPGVAYDPVSDKFVVWNGGADVYTLNLSTYVWTRIPPAATNTVIPTAPDIRGTYGRFRYIPSKNAFIVVNSTNENVYIYKMSAGGGAPADSILPNKINDLRTK